MAELLPAILAQDAASFALKLKRVEHLVDFVQVDCMDGDFVSGVSWYDGVALSTLATPLSYDLHLMVKDPLGVLSDWQHVPTLARATVHLETLGDAENAITFIQKRGLEICIAVNPETPLEALRPLLPRIGSVLIMGVHPGKSGQEMLPGTVERVAAVRAMDAEMPIGVDGGVTLATAKKLMAAGATRLIAASSIFQAADIKEAIREFQALT